MANVEMLALASIAINNEDASIARITMSGFGYLLFFDIGNGNSWHISGIPQILNGRNRREISEFWGQFT